MKVPRLARVAGESFSLITGANIAYEDLDGEKPEGFEAGPTENPEDDDVSMDADLNLAWPDQDLIKKWWNDRQGNFAKGTRYLLGKPISEESLALRSRMAISVSAGRGAWNWPSSIPAVPCTRFALQDGGRRPRNMTCFGS